MEIQEISAPVWANAEKTAIDCMVKFRELDFAVPYTAMTDDSDDNGRFIFDWCINNFAEGIANYIPPEIDYVAQAEQERERRLTEANSVTADWRTWLQLGAISAEERISLTNWMVYIRELRALEFADVEDEVSYSSIAWPDKPQ